jgi:hypothetical protein
MRLQVASDLCLGSSDRNRAAAPDLPACAPYLALLGDLGDPGSPAYADLLCQLAPRYRRVLVVCGNEECHGRTLEEAHALVAGACRASGCVFLEREAVELDGVAVLGCTLWTSLPGPPGPHESKGGGTDLLTCFNADMRSIAGWGWAANQARHEGDVAWALSALAQAAARGQGAVLLTHHAPLLGGATLAPRDRGGPLAPLFATDLPGLLLQPPLLAWCHGHTRHSHATTVGGVKVVSNQGQQCGFEPGCVVVVRE